MLKSFQGLHAVQQKERSLNLLVNIKPSVIQVAKADETHPCIVSTLSFK